MGHHKSRRDHSRSKHKRRSTSSSSSRNDRRNQQYNRLKKLEEKVNNLVRAKESSCIHAEFEQRIPVFDLLKNDLTIEKWIEHVDNMAKLHNWDNITTIKSIPSSLNGYARELWPRLAWTEIKELLKQQFSKPVPFAKLFKEAALYENVPGQSLEDYCLQKLDKMRKLNLNIPDKYLIDAVIEGITNKDIAKTIRNAQHRNTNDLLAHMINLQ